MTNVTHKFLIYLSIYFYLTCFWLSFSPSSEEGIQFRQRFKSPGYGVSARALTPYPGRSKWINKLKTCALRWSLYNFSSKENAQVAIIEWYCLKQLFCDAIRKLTSRWQHVPPRSEICCSSSCLVFGLEIIELLQMR
jgi:hypothetical protein